jgi:hypothetical protein
MTRPDNQSHLKTHKARGLVGLYVRTLDQKDIGRTRLSIQTLKVNRKR